MLTTILLEHLCTHGVPGGPMAEEQLSFSPAALAGGLESQTCQLLQSEHQKVTDAAFKLDLLSQELQSMWSAQGSPATLRPLQEHGRSVSAPDFSGALSRLERQSEHGGGLWAGVGGPVQTPTLSAPQSLPSPYTFDPLPVPQPVPQPVKPPRTQRGRLERGRAVPYSPEEQRQSDRNLIPYSPEEQRQSDRAPSPRLMQGYQIPYYPEEQRQPDRNLIPYSPEEQRQSDRYLTVYSPEEQRHPSERAPSPRLLPRSLAPYSPQEPPRPDRLLQPLAPDHHHHHYHHQLAPSFHPAAEVENPYGAPSTLRDPALPPAGDAHSPPGVYSPATAPTFYVGAGSRGSPQYPPISTVTERGKLAFDTVDASPTARSKPDFTANIYTGDGGSQRKPAGVWAEADLDIAYERKSKAPIQESKGDPRSWSLPRLGRDNWKQTDLDLAIPTSKVGPHADSNTRRDFW
ncbi:relA-associated inhibitor isoform X2 [Leucoraja erinacea]|uniref:relA-associated inhibitor isoform X2 n=1 Tax=Leucoraja erinaceus TaxID=7782 RepID=UPI0024550386|nr:relA-associated inhibitor isoform X2 [Leucoraja erinacea]